MVWLSTWKRDHASILLACSYHLILTRAPSISGVKSEAQPWTILWFILWRKKWEIRTLRSPFKLICLAKTSTGAQAKTSSSLAYQLLKPIKLDNSLNWVLYSVESSIPSLSSPMSLLKWLMPQRESSCHQSIWPSWTDWQQLWPRLIAPVSQCPAEPWNSPPWTRYRSMRPSEVFQRPAPSNSADGYTSVKFATRSRKIILLDKRLYSQMISSMKLPLISQVNAGVSLRTQRRPWLPYAVSSGLATTATTEATPPSMALSISEMESRTSTCLSWFEKQNSWSY